MPLPMPPLIPCYNRTLALLVACACACAGALAQEPPATPAMPATSTGELPARARIQQQRQAVQAQLQQQEAACRQRFAVEDCLRKARSAARAQDNLLWRQELELDEAERRDRAAQRLRAIEERSGSQEPPAVAPEGRLPPPGGPGGHEAEAQLRARQASERASQARQRQQAHEAAQQQRAQQQAERLEQSRQRYEARQQKARERRAEHERQRAQDAAEGRPAARPLPSLGD